MRKYIATLERQRTETAQVVVEFDDADLPKETLPREWAGKLARDRAPLAQFASESKPLRVTNLQEMEDEIQPFRDTCFFCDQKFGDCDCPWPSAAMGSFKWNDFDIRSPNADETGRSFVDPVAYYGDAFTRWWEQRGARWPGRRRFKGHPEIAIPRCLLDAGFEDVSWKNDECACAHLELTDGRLLVAWVGADDEPVERRPLSARTMERIAAGVKKFGLEAHPTVAFVANAAPKRFGLAIGPRQHVIDGDEPTPVIDTGVEDDFAAAVALLAKQAAPKPPRLRDRHEPTFVKVLAAMDSAEELQGPFGKDYIELMEGIEDEARHRRETYQAVSKK